MLFYMFNWFNYNVGIESLRIQIRKWCRNIPHLSCWYKSDLGILVFACAVVLFQFIRDVEIFPAIENEDECICVILFVLTRVLTCKCNYVFDQDIVNVLICNIWNVILFFFKI